MTPWVHPLSPPSTAPVTAAATSVLANRAIGLYGGVVRCTEDYWEALGTTVRLHGTRLRLHGTRLRLSETRLRLSEARLRLYLTRLRLYLTRLRLYLTRLRLYMDPAEAVYGPG